MDITPEDGLNVMPELVVPDIDNVLVPVPVVLNALNWEVLIGTVTVVAIVDGPLTTIDGLTVTTSGRLSDAPTASVTVTDS